LTFWLWLKKHFKKQEPKLNPIKEYDKAVENFNRATKKLTGKIIDVSIDTLAKQPTHPKEVNFRISTSKPAVKQDIGKFMKHGHQAPYYRKSIKAKIQPDEEEDYFDEQENPAD
jgi:hypothetical protein